MQQNATVDLLSTDGKWFKDEYHTACPWCGGTDRFVVFDDGRYWCRQCGRSGDAVQLLRERDGLTYAQACERLGLQAVPSSQPAPPRQNGASNRVQLGVNYPSLRVSKPAAAAHDVAAWQAKAGALVERAYDYLLDDKAPHVWDYLLGERRLAKWSVLMGRLGYIPVPFGANFGGLDVHVDAGLCIPWDMGRQSNPFKVNVRRDACADGLRYLAAKGSQNGAYLIWRVRPGLPVVLVEGEIDALSIDSACRDAVVGVATGSTTGGRLLSAVAALALASVVLVAFDTDEAGEKAAQWWLAALPNAKRWLPTQHDVNDMLRAGDDVRGWVYEGVHRANA